MVRDVRHWCYRALDWSGATRLVRASRRGSLVLCYHNVVDRAAVGADPGLHMSLDRFRRQVDWLAAHYRVVPLEELVAAIWAGGSGRRLAALTFDDGYAGTFEFAIPLLRGLGLPATVFLVTGAAASGRGFWWDHPATRAPSAAERDTWLSTLHGDAAAILNSLGATDAAGVSPWHAPASWAVIRRALGPDLTIGAHSVSHRALPALSADELEHEVTRPAHQIVEELDVRPAFFAYPYGMWDQRVRAAVAAAGYRAAFTLQPGLNPPRSDLLALRRTNVPAAIAPAAFAAWAAGLHPFWKR